MHVYDYKTFCKNEGLFDYFKKKPKPEDYGITKYNIRPDGSLDVLDNLIYGLYDDFPFKLNIVTGFFDCSDKDLSTFDNLPKEIHGDFDCSDNIFTSFEGIPYIKGECNMSNNLLDSLKGCPETMNSLDISDNNSISFEYFPCYINGYLVLDGIYDLDIEDYPLTIISENIHSDIKEYGNNMRISILYNKINRIVKNNKEIFEPIIKSKNKIKFHQMLMILDNSLIELYTTIKLPNKTRLLI